MKKGFALLVLICMFLVSSLGFSSCDTISGSVYVGSPIDGTTYHTNNVDMWIQVFQENLEGAKMTYTLDNVQFSLETYQGHAGANSQVGDTTLSNLSEGEHTLVIRGTGTFFSYTGPLNQAFDPVTVHFFVNTTQPALTPSPSPSETPNPTQTIALSASGLEYLVVFIVVIVLIAIAVTVALVFRRKHTENNSGKAKNML
jgi:hypothetical protein